MTDRYQPLRTALAAGPTPGPWKSSLPARPTPDAPEGGDCAIRDSGADIIAEVFYRVGHGPSGTRPAAANAALIAAADPDTIRTLLDERDALREALESARAGLAWYRDMCPEHVDASDDEADELIDAALQLGETE